MLHFIDRIYQEEAAQLFLTALQVGGPHSLVIYAFTMDYNIPSLAEVYRPARVAFVSRTGIPDLLDKTRKRINARTKDLFEVSTRYQAPL
jgi:hypothetical protein